VWSVSSVAVLPPLLSGHQDDRPTSDLASMMVVEAPPASMIWSHR
jgi:hypothetical protein